MLNTWCSSITSKEQEYIHRYTSSWSLLLSNSSTPATVHPMQYQAASNSAASNPVAHPLRLVLAIKDLGFPGSQRVSALFHFLAPSRIWVEFALSLPVSIKDLGSLGSQKVGAFLLPVSIEDLGSSGSRKSLSVLLSLLFPSRLRVPLAQRMCIVIS